MSKILKQIIIISCTLLWAFFSLCSQNVINVHAVTTSETNYMVNIKGYYAFIGNEIAGSDKIGTEYFMTYTVKSAPVVTLEQHGLYSAVDMKQRIPYQNGGFVRTTTNEDSSLLQEGATYFIKWKIAEGGFTYDILRVKGEREEYILLDEYWGWPTGGNRYCGLYIAGAVEAELTNVRCYNAAGKNLNVFLTEGEGRVFEDVDIPKDTQVNHYYDVTVTQQGCIALSNRRIPTSDTVYMEYTVESADILTTQDGIILSNSPYETYPYNDGVLASNSYPEQSTESILFEPGASYIIQMKRTEDGNLESIVQKKKNGEKTLYTFSQYQPFSPDVKAGYFSLWLGDWTELKSSFQLKNFKCYDSNKNNLGVQCNRAFYSKHYGALEDYAGCEAVYYCEENQNILALYADKTLKFTKSGVTEEATYTIAENRLTAKYEKTEESLDYLYQKITDNQGNIYKRLYDYTVTFITGNDTTIPEQKLSSETGYTVMRPTDPSIEGKEFEGWYTGDGKKFEFEQIVTESMTLYTKYSGEALKVSGSIQGKTVILIGAGVLLVTGALVYLVLRKRGTKNDSNNEK